MNDVPRESCSDPIDTPAPFRLLSIRARTSGDATDFFLASALFDHRSTLRSTGEEDARCVEPTSATHTNYVHPHLARSRLTSLVTQRGRPTETKAPYDTIGGPSVSRHSKTASADRHCVLTSSSTPSRAGDTSVGVFFPRHSGDRASDTPVAIFVHPSASPSFPGAASSPYVRVFTGWYGSEGAKTAETIDCAFS
jgi:hypothetical protein